MGTWRNGSGRLTVEGPDGSGAGAVAAEPGAAESEAAGSGAAEPGAAEPVAAEPVAVEIAASYGTRRRGLLGRDGIEGALLITPCNSVHTFRMRFAIDVAYLDKELRVIDVHTLKPGRLPLPRWKARHVLEAEAGAMERWGLRPGARITVNVQDVS